MTGTTNPTRLAGQHFKAATTLGHKADQPGSGRVDIVSTTGQTVICNNNSNNKRDALFPLAEQTRRGGGWGGGGGCGGQNGP